MIYHELGKIDDGSPIPSTTRATVYPRELDVPPLSEQRAIAAVLGSLDDKIEQNRRTSAALERLARAIFRAWFVDFEPVKAKAAGAASFPSMTQEVFDGLPSRLVDSELGPVPEGWQIVDVYKIANVIYGAPFKSKLFNEDKQGTPLIRIRDLQTHLPGVYGSIPFLWSCSCVVTGFRRLRLWRWRLNRDVAFQLRCHIGRLPFPIELAIAGHACGDLRKRLLPAAA